MENMGKVWELLWNIYNEADEAVFSDVKIINDETPALDEKAAYPLFLNATEEYLRADIKLMIFGQETNNWSYVKKWGEDKKVYGSSDKIDVEDIMDFYRDFFPCPPNTKFWQYTRKFVEKLQAAVNPKKSDFLWNNIVKMGRQSMNFPERWYEPIIKPYFNGLIPKEIEILKPDFIVFFTGPTQRYENVLDDVFGNPMRKDVAGFDNKDLCEVVIPNVKKAYRTYHPRALNTIPNKEQIFETIISGFM